MDHHIIGLTGPARSGKNTVAEIITQEWSGPVREVAFADLIKLSAAKALGIKFSPDAVGTRAVRVWADVFKVHATIQIVDNRTGEVDHEISGRDFLQRYGTEAHRNLFDADFWVNYARLYEPGDGLVVVTDVRFDNEAHRIKTMEGSIWKVSRADVGPANAHASERPIDASLIDVEIPNNGSYSDLRSWVSHALSRLV